MASLKKKIKTSLDFPLLTQEGEQSPPSIKHSDISSRSNQQPPTSSAQQPSPKSPNHTESSVNSSSPPPTPSDTNRIHTPKQNFSKATVTPSKRTGSMVRIKSQATTTNDLPIADFGNNPFTYELFINVWNEYILMKKNKIGNYSFSVLSNCTPKYVDHQTTIHVIFSNASSELEFTKVLSTDTLTYLKKHLKNNHITFSTEINKAEAKTVLYTNAQKFTYFADTHPELLLWKRQLALELK